MWWYFVAFVSNMAIIVFSFSLFRQPMYVWTRIARTAARGTPPTPVGTAPLAYAYRGVFVTSHVYYACPCVSSPGFLLVMEYYTVKRNFGSEAAVNGFVSFRIY